MRYLIVRKAEREYDRGPSMWDMPCVRVEADRYGIADGWVTFYTGDDPVGSFVAQAVSMILTSAAEPWTGDGPTGHSDLVAQAWQPLSEYREHDRPDEGVEPDRHTEA